MTTIVEGAPKTPFSIALHQGVGEGCYFFPQIAPLYPWYTPYNAESSVRRYQVPFFKSLVWCNLGLNPGLPGHWRRLYPLVQWSEGICF